MVGNTEAIYELQKKPERCREPRIWSDYTMKTQLTLPELGNLLWLIPTAVSRVRVDLVRGAPG
jgi:hypothetical protein